MRPREIKSLPQVLTGVPIKKQSWLKKNKTKQYHFNSRVHVLPFMSKILSFMLNISQGFAIS